MLTIKDIAVRYSVNNATAAKYIGLSFTWKSKYTRREKRKTMIDPSGLEELDKLVQARRKRAQHLLNGIFFRFKPTSEG